MGEDGGQHGVGIPWLALGENIPLPGGHLEEGGLPFQDQKSHQAPLSGPSTPGHSFLLCFTLDSRHLNRPATAFLGENDIVCTTRLSSRGREWVF